MKHRLPWFVPRGRLSRLRLKSAPLGLSLLATVLFIATLPLADGALWQGFLLAVPFLVAVTGLGWRGGVVLAPVALCLLFLGSGASGRPAPASAYAFLTLTMLLATVAGQQIFLLWRLSERRARQSERKALLLQEATVQINQSADVDALFRNAPRLLSDLLPFTHAEIFVPEEDCLRLHTSWRWIVQPDFTIPLNTVSGRAFTTGESQYVPDTGADPDFMPAPGAQPTLSELALPIVTDGVVRAVLNLEHEQLDAFGSDVRESLDAYVRMVEEVLRRLDATAQLLSAKSEQKVLSDLSQRLLSTDGLDEAASAALEELLPGMDVDCGAFLVLKHGRLRPLATWGELPPLTDPALSRGLPLEGSLEKAWRERRAIFLDSVDGPVWTSSDRACSVALVPVVDSGGRMQALLALTRTGGARAWTDAQRRTLQLATAPLSTALERSTLNRQLLAMLAVIRQLRSVEAPEVLYRQAAEAAVELVPGAEAVSILVSHDGLFHYEAAVGWDLAVLQEQAGPFTLPEMRKWYADADNGFEHGRARLLKGEDIVRYSGTSQHTPLLLEGGRLKGMLSQVMVPIADGGQIVAILNLDNFSTEDAFSGNSLRLAEAFAQHIAVLVQQAEQVVALERSAVTDPLTGLGNRAGFERAVRQELARARRYDHPLNVVMIDLDNFKRINDSFGHAVGDRALMEVATALKESKRAHDSVFRWGGDEFVLLLPEVTPESARLAMHRLAAIASATEVQGIHLGASVGLASYPVDGQDGAALLALADSRMYESKLARSRGAGADQAPTV